MKTRNPVRERPFLSIILLSLLFLCAFGGGILAAQTPESTPANATESEMLTGEAPAGGTPTDEAPAPTPTSPFEGVLETRTPEPTATPGVLAEQAEQLARAVGLATTTFLGLAAADWINLGFSLLYILAGYLIGTWLIRGILPPVVRRTPTQFDDRLLEGTGPQLRWVVVLLALHFATIRLGFLAAEVKEILTNIYFVLGLFIALRIVLKLIDLADEWYRERSARVGREDELAPVITLLVRLGRVSAGLVALIIGLSQFGVNVSAFAAALGLGGLAISLAAKDTIADAIAGFIILVDRPFRIGDRIEIQEVGTWGDVTDIGLRTTRIRTRDNRMVIVPNSVIGANQVINYTYPDPRYRIETHVGIAYGTDIETARRVIVDAVCRVEGVLPEKPVDALYNEMGDSAMVFRVRWWIESYVDTRRIVDRVHTALQHALDAAGIESPYPTQTLNVQVEPGEAEQRAQAKDRSERAGNAEAD
jgi:small-conductance mechanosensitive channel